MSSTTHEDTTVRYTVWTEPAAKRGHAATFTVRCRETGQIAYGPTTNGVAATRANMRLNDGLMNPNYAHANGHGRA